MIKKSEKSNFIFRLFAIALLVFVFWQTVSLAFLISTPKTALATDMSMNLQVPIPNLTGGETKINIKFDSTTKPIADYIMSIYNYAIGVVGILAAVVMMIGGLMWITAGGNTSNIGEAKAMITASLTGLVLVLTSYLILSNVNPALVNLQSSVISPVTPSPSTTTAPCNNCTNIANSGFNISENACCHDQLKCEIKPCEADKDLLNKLKGFKSQFTITGAWPPTPGAHTAGSCHDSGSCVDLVPTGGSTADLLGLAGKLKSVNAVYIQFESSRCSELTAYLGGITCKNNPQSSGEHFHVQLQGSVVPEA